MRKGKLDLAKDGAMNLIEKIPKGNIASLISFGNSVNVVVEEKEPTYALEAIPSLKVAGNTAIYTAEEKYNIIMESFQNPNITIEEICRNHGVAVSLFYKWDNDGSFRSIM